MAGSRTLLIAGTMDIKVKFPSETVGNGLCAVPYLKGRNRSRKSRKRPPYVIPIAAVAEWRNLPRW